MSNLSHAASECLLLIWQELISLLAVPKVVRICTWFNSSHVFIFLKCPFVCVLQRNDMVNETVGKKSTGVKYPELQCT